MTFGGADSVRPPLEVTAREFVAVKSYKAKGKRLTTYAVDHITELEPLEAPTVDDEFDPDNTPGESPRRRPTRQSPTMWSAATMKSATSSQARPACLSDHSATQPDIGR